MHSPNQMSLPEHDTMPHPSHEKRSKISKNPNDFDAYGFDMDHTLLEYHLDYKMEKIYEYIQGYFVDTLHISKEVFSPFQQIKHMCFRGVIFDVDTGNLLQADKDGVIVQAFHGLTALTKEKRIELYGEGTWEKWEEIFESYTNGIYPDANRETTGARFIADSEFGTPGAGIFACVVESMKKSEAEDKKQEFGAVFKRLVQAYTQFYKESDASFYSMCLQDSDKFVKRMTDKTIHTLKTLKSNGKCIFLLTTSDFKFANDVLQVIYGKDWRDLFTVVLTQARKPKFFKSIGQLLYRVSMKDGNMTAVDKVEEGNAYKQGNIDYLNAFLRSFTKKDTPSVLYVGDSLQSDVYWSSRIAGWKCACIVANIHCYMDKQTKDSVQNVETEFVPNGNITTPNGSNAFWFDRVISLSYLLATDMCSLSRVLCGDICVEDSSDVIMGYSY